MRRNTGRFSGYIRPFSYGLDLIIINLLAEFILNQSITTLYFHIYVSFTWLVISWNIGFYEIYRYTNLPEIYEKILKQYIAYVIVNFAFIGFFSKLSAPAEVFKFTTTVVLLISAEKLFFYYFLKRFRVIFGGNYRNVVLIGEQKNTNQLAHFFNDNPDYGYRLQKTFDIETEKKSKIQECYQFVLENKIDEIYCSIEDLSNSEVNDLIDFSDNNLKTLKFLPNKKEPTSRNLKYDYYGYIPIISLRNIPQEIWLNKMVKRVFDIVFSILIIVFLLSWLVPIMALLIKLESEGPVFFKQGRPGYNEKEFFCYKFRSMRINNTTEKEASKGDPRVTKTGRFIRKTSMDELPQFLNVLKGEMSVVGPRPHLWSQNKSYANKIKKYMVRHYVKPGITGLAQVKGFRGEIETDEDMINRINLDVFYIENWSLFMDIKIIFQTVVNIFKGEEKAY